MNLRKPESLVEAPRDRQIVDTDDREGAVAHTDTIPRSDLGRRGGDCVSQACFKARVLAENAAEPRCERITVAVDLQQS